MVPDPGHPHMKQDCAPPSLGEFHLSEWSKRKEEKEGGLLTSGTRRQEEPDRSLTPVQYSMWF